MEDSMKKLLLLTSVCYSLSTLAATDYSYCMKQLNSMKLPNVPCDMKKKYTECYEKATQEGKTSYFPFELSSEGKMQIHPSLNLKTENGNEVLESNGDFGDFKTIITKNANGDITNIETKSEMKLGDFGQYGPGTDDKEATKLAERNKLLRSFNLKMEIKNGKCIPSRLEGTTYVGNQSRQDVIFEMQLCRDLNQFFKKNPEAKGCFDKGLMSKVDNIFNNYYKRNPDIYGEVATMNLDFFRPQPLKTRSGMTGYGGVDVGMGIGMNGMMGLAGPYGAQSMLQPFGPTVDVTLASSPKTGGGSPVIAAKNALATCEGGILSSAGKIAEDESVWATETSTSKVDASKAIKK